MNRLLFLLSLLMVALPLAHAHAFGEEVGWIDKTLSPELQAKLAGPAIWHHVNANLDNFSPKPDQPFEMKTACTDKVASAFYSELIDRGAITMPAGKCIALVLWYAEGNTGLTYTYQELQKKFLPLDSPEEAASFMAAAGMNSRLPWYGATVDGVIYMMNEQNFCRGLGHIRRMYRMNAEARAMFIGSVIDPAPKNSGCTLNSP